MKLKELQHLETLNIEGNPLPVEQMSRVALIGVLLMKGIDIDRTSTSAYNKALNARYENIKMSSWADEQNRKTAMEAI